MSAFGVGDFVDSLGVDKRTTDFAGGHIMRTIKRAMHFAFSGVLIGYRTFAVMREAASQEAGWITLFDGKDLDGWNQVGGSNWHVEDVPLSPTRWLTKKRPGTLSR